MLISKKACELGRFDWHYQGEDVAFCESLQRNGIRIFCDTSIELKHLMDLKMLNKYKEEIL